MPDYVFDESYPLLSLKELRAFIEQEKHLPNIPTAEEVRQRGLNLSHFQLRLLEKIEELALYLLAQQQEIEELKKQMSAE